MNDELTQVSAAGKISGTSGRAGAVKNGVGARRSSGMVSLTRLSISKTRTRPKPAQLRSKVNNP